jgi:hypothetical protein
MLCRIAMVLWFDGIPERLVRIITTRLLMNIIHLLIGYGGNSTFVIPKVPTIFRGNAEENSWYREDNKSGIIRISSL